MNEPDIGNNILDSVSSNNGNSVGEIEVGMELGMVIKLLYLIYSIQHVINFINYLYVILDWEVFKVYNIT